MTSPSQDHLNEVKRKVEAVVAALDRAPNAEAETSALAAGTLDPGTHEALIGIEALKGEIALRATTSDLNAVKIQIEQLKTLLWRTLVVGLGAIILWLGNLVMRLVASNPASITPQP